MPSEEPTFDKKGIVKEVTPTPQEYSYYNIPCEGQGSISSQIVFSWYKGINQIKFDDDRTFIDSNGNKNFTLLNS